MKGSLRVDGTELIDTKFDGMITGRNARASASKVS